MMTSFVLTPVEKGVMRCRHTAPLTPDDVKTMARFLSDYRGRLLIDLTGADVAECARHITNLRPMMPTTAIFGADPGAICVDVPESYYTHDVRCFAGEDEALAWLREQ
jgi:uncharacterized protein (DUF3820 family)